MLADSPAAAPMPGVQAAPWPTPGLKSMAVDCKPLRTSLRRSWAARTASLMRSWTEGSWAMAAAAAPGVKEAAPTFKVDFGAAGYAGGWEGVCEGTCFIAAFS